MKRYAFALAIASFLLISVMPLSVSAEETKPILEYNFDDNLDGWAFYDDGGTYSFVRLVNDVDYDGDKAVEIGVEGFLGGIAWMSNLEDYNDTNIWSIEFNYSFTNTANNTYLSPYTDNQRTVYFGFDVITENDGKYYYSWLNYHYNSTENVWKLFVDNVDTGLSEEHIESGEFDCQIIIDTYEGEVYLKGQKSNKTFDFDKYVVSYDPPQSSIVFNNANKDDAYLYVDNFKLYNINLLSDDNGGGGGDDDNETGIDFTTTSFIGLLLGGLGIATAYSSEGYDFREKITSRNGLIGIALAGIGIVVFLFSSGVI